MEFELKLPTQRALQHDFPVKNLLPEEQRHAFSTGGMVLSRSHTQSSCRSSVSTPCTFFEHNAAVDGCAEKSEPGYQQMEWLRIQLQFIRQRGIKAILMEHVPPAGTEVKLLWHETC